MGRTACLSAALLIVASCGGSPARPTQGTSPPQPSNPPSPGEITVGEVTPSSGATLVLRDCGRSGLCTDQLQTTFDVLVAADMPNAWLVVSLRQGSLPCAAFYSRATLNGGNRTSFSTSSIAMVHDEEGRLLCPMPVETTRLVFQVFYESAPANPLLDRELPYRYTLATQ